MWTPATIRGVPRDYGLVLLLLVGVAIPVLKVLLTIPFALLLYAFGAVMGRRDPEFLTIVIVHVFRIKKTLGEFKGNEYTP